MKIRSVLPALTLVVTLASLATAHAQAFPTKPIQWIVGFPPGGGADFVARAVTRQMSANLGQSIVVENRPGASSIIAAQAVAQAAPDGYTLFGADGGALVLNPALYAKLPYDPVRDFAPVSLIIRAPLLIVVHPSFPAADLKTFIAMAKQQPGKLNYASPGRGTHHHLAMELFKTRVGIDVTDIVYKGAGPAVQDVLSGQVPVGILDSVVTLAHLRAGKLRTLMVFNGARLPQLPDVPSITELGVPDAEVAATVGVVAPKATPREIVARLSAEVARAMSDPDLKKRLSDLGMEPISTTPEQYTAYLEAEARRFQPLIKSLNIRLD